MGASQSSEYHTKKAELKHDLVRSHMTIMSHTSARYLSRLKSILKGVLPCVPVCTESQTGGPSEQQAES